MANLITRIREKRELAEARNSIDYYLQNYIIPAATQFSYQGHAYQVTGIQQSWGDIGGRAREVAGSLPTYMNALRYCPPAFAAQMVRSIILSQMRFTFRNVPWHPDTPRRLFGTADLERLEHPWPNGTTGDMVAKMEWHEGLAGNSYVAIQAKRLRLLRPDWVGIIYGSDREPDDPMWAIDAEVLAYAYMAGGFTANKGRLETFLPNEIVHWMPLPDPESPSIGMSWMTPGIRDMQGDKMITEHKLKFFTNGATPNMVIKGLPTASKELFDAAVDMIEEKHTGLANAYRTLYLSAGADATVVGATQAEMQFVEMQGKGETRIAMLSRVPASVLQISEGLQGSALNAGNWIASRRNFSDSWAYPYMQNLASSFDGKVVKNPVMSQLWFDVADMPILREDAKDQADIASTDAATIGDLVREGFIPTTAIAAVVGRNMGLLKHSGLVSVQLQPPGTTQPTPTAPPGPGSDGPPAPNGKQPPPAKGNGKVPSAPVKVTKSAEPPGLTEPEEHVVRDLALSDKGLPVVVDHHTDTVPESAAPAVAVVGSASDHEPGDSRDELHAANNALAEALRNVAERPARRTRKTTHLLTDPVTDAVIGKVEEEEEIP